MMRDARRYLAGFRSGFIAVGGFLREAGLESKESMRLGLKSLAAKILVVVAYLAAYRAALLQKARLGAREAAWPRVKVLAQRGLTTRGLITGISSACNCWAARAKGTILSRIRSADRAAPVASSSEIGKVKRPAGVTIIAVVTFVCAVILGTGALTFFFIAVMAVSGGDGGDPISASIAGMGVAGGFSLLVLAGVTGYVGLGVLRLEEWARAVTIASITVGICCTILSIFAFAGHPILPVVPMTIGYILIMGTAVSMLAYLARPQVKQAFRAVTA